jgi:hypothetical protein
MLFTKTTTPMIRTIYKQREMNKNPYSRPSNARSYTKETLLESLRREVRTWNKNFTKEYVESLPVRALLCFTHPAYRDEYYYWAYELKMIEHVHNQ